MSIWKPKRRPVMPKSRAGATLSKPPHQSLQQKNCGSSLKPPKTALALSSSHQARSAAYHAPLSLQPLLAGPGSNGERSLHTEQSKLHWPWRTTVRSAALALIVALPSSLLAQSGTGRPQQTLPKIKIQAGIHLIQAEVANTPQTQAMGLMYRQSLPLNGGMLFVFKQPQAHCFWMQNTPLPLSIAFIADDGTIVNIAKMKPLATASHCAEKPVRFALEMEQGWFDRKGFSAGSKLIAKGLFKDSP